MNADTRAHTHIWIPTPITLHCSLTLVGSNTFYYISYIFFFKLGQLLTLYSVKTCYVVALHVQCELLSIVLHYCSMNTFWLLKLGLQRDKVDFNSKFTGSMQVIVNACMQKSDLIFLNCWVKFIYKLSMLIKLQ